MKTFKRSQPYIRSHFTTKHICEKAVNHKVNFKKTGFIYSMFILFPKSKIRIESLHRQRDISEYLHLRGESLSNDVENNFKPI